MNGEAMRDTFISLRMNLIFLVLTGLVFPFTVYIVAQLLFPYRANGSLLKDSSGNLIGSEIIGQSFTAPGYFHPRPSAAGAGYDAANSGGTNLGPTSAKLVEGKTDFRGVKDLASAWRKENGLAADARIPADAVTRSASGLDPHISPANALAQVERVAGARNLDAAVVRQLVQNNIEARFIGIFGEPRVNVLKLNMALDMYRPQKVLSLKQGRRAEALRVAPVVAPRH